MEFNAISSEINKRVSTHVLLPIAEYFDVGVRLSFVGAATVHEETPEIDPLMVVPIKLEL